MQDYVVIFCNEQKKQYMFLQKGKFAFYTALRYMFTMFFVFLIVINNERGGGGGSLIQTEWAGSWRPCLLQPGHWWGRILTWIQKRPLLRKVECKKKVECCINPGVTLWVWPHLETVRNVVTFNTLSISKIRYSLTFTQLEFICFYLSTFGLIVLLPMYCLSTSSTWVWSLWVNIVLEPWSSFKPNSYYLPILLTWPWPPFKKRNDPNHKTESLLAAGVASSSSHGLMKF